MKIKIGYSEQYKSWFVLPQIWISWDSNITISLCWMKWCLDFDFINNDNK